MSAASKLSVKVPASSANLGVGFDVLGLALDLMSTYSFEYADELRITGCEAEWANENNLVWTSYLKACEELGSEAHLLHIHEDCPIPNSGGLGSSSTCVIAGVVAAMLLSGHSFDRQRALNLSARIEGHPDNVAPAIEGGLVSSYMDGECCFTTSWDIHDELRFVCVAPPYRVLTSAARDQLPKSVSSSTVAWQVGHCLSMVQALGTADLDAIRTSCHDLMHEPYRAKLIPDFDRLKELALDAGAAAFLISGSGASMLAISTQDEAATLEARLKEAAPEMWVQTLEVQKEGTTYYFD